MRAVVCNALGALEQLAYQEVPEPTLGPGQALVSTRAMGVNFPDALLVLGQYQLRPEPPFVPGFEFCGQIEQVAQAPDLVSKTTALQPGARVMGMTQLGAFAEKIAIDARLLIPVPDFVPDQAAANLMCAHGTAHHALKQRAKLQAGETLVVLGAAGGTGLAAVQIGKAMGARVIAVCSTEEKLALARANGADELINSSEQDLKQTIKLLTEKRGADVVYDTVGGDAFAACSSAMARNGRLLVIGFASGQIPNFPVNLALVKEFSVIGVFWGNFVKAEPQVFAENMRELFAWYAEGHVRVHIDQVFGLSETANALQSLLSRQVKGKVVLVP